MSLTQFIPSTNTLSYKFSKMLGYILPGTSLLIKVHKVLWQLALEKLSTASHL